MLEKTFDPKSAEPRLYARWEASGAFRPEEALARNPDAKPFCMVIPPPNVTGSLHIGHALNTTLQDILARYHRMKGEAVLWLPGTDHAGIATQMVVERQLAAEGNIGRRDMSREDFVDRVWAWKAQSGGTITQQLRRLGASCDWSRERFTLDEGLSAAVRKVFVELHRKGLIYRDKRLVNWDPHFQTAISDLEVETREVQGKMWWFAYPLEGEPIDGVSEIVIATTRPETMLGDGAVAVHPDDERYTKFVGRMVKLPIADRLIPIIADEYPDPEKGSGAVKITGAHDFNDFQVAQRHGLSMISIMDERARMTGPIPERYQGVEREHARRMVVQEIEALGLLREIEDKLIAQPHGDRSGVVIEPFLTDQWYVDAKTLAAPAIAAVEDGRTVFEPRNWEKTYFEWMRNIEPWCISRQLWWGHRIPAWYVHDWVDEDFKPKLRDVIVFETPEEAEAEIFRRFPNVVWAEDLSDAQTKIAELGFTPSNGPPSVYRDNDVLDTWFSSALWPFSTLGWPEDTADLQRFYPTDTLVTGFDIIFFWVARMMMMGLEFRGEVPFRRVVINGLVRDERGQKMSKSKGNVIDPLDIVDELGCDALRFTMAMLSGTRDIKLSKTRIEGYRNFGTKLWNAARFCQMNECVADPAFDPGAVCETLNRWIRSETTAAAHAVTAALDGADFAEAASVLYRFIWNVVCDWYLELAKPILNGGEGRAKAETRATIAWVLDQALRLLHPVSPFITEELWEQTAEFGPARQTLLIETPWPDLPAAWIDPAAEAEIDWLIALVTEVRSVRAEMNVPPSAKPPLTLIAPDAETRSRLARNRDRLCSLARLDTVREADAAPPGAVLLGGVGAALSVAGFIDLAAERARLEKGVASAEQDIARTAKKLANPDFIARAKPEVVEAERAKLAEAEATLARLKAGLARLRGLD
ncbi:valine--tRNA ligase [Caulobacter sp. S45]|uniref:valine--tRNA ligase n=1 Tax=Caulobacter sp. S45 TaxID=1641861 RepID=UPI001576AD5E|nr:valine--tRNA ligase [Caulobacter sp. S45]